MNSTELEQLRAELKTGIGGSDVGAICGCNPWMTEHQVFLKKLGMLETETNEAMEAGILFEEPIGRRYAEKNNVLLWKPELVRHPEYPFILGHMDFIVVRSYDADFPDHGNITTQHGRSERTSIRPLLKDALWGVEIKTVGEWGFKSGDWGEEMTDKVPHQYLLQCQHYLMCMPELPFMDMYVCVGGNKFRTFRIKPNKKLQASLISRETAFWQRVQDKEPPDVDGSPGAKEFLDQWFQADTELHCDCTPELDQLVSNHLTTKKLIAEQYDELEKIDQKIKKEMGNATLLETPDAKVTWKDVMSRRVDTKELRKTHAKIAEKLTKVSTTRTFKVNKITRKE